MSKIEIRNLYLIFGKEKHKAEKMLKEGKTKEEILKATGCTVAVKDANLSINEGEIFVIMGLSGSGKSTLLRCINRLIRPTSGEIIINETDISKASKQELLQIRRKELAMVFQHFGLLPHRSVLHNIAFGLELQGVKKGEREKKAMECMQQVGLKGYESQMVGQLSGGMQQRVGLARALANNPEVLLMDEAFSALDPLIRVQMQDELLTLQSKMKKTIVFITHDLNEAIKLGDRIAIMKDGEIVQTGTSEEILTEPANAYVERFVENVDRSKIITASSIMVDKLARERAKKANLHNRKLRDCRYHLNDGKGKEQESESCIFITEGDSASGSITKSRDVNTQAVFSLRGKPLNSFGLTKKVVYENEEFNLLQAALNIEDGIEGLRYNKVIAATDADVDGMHIRLLLITFFLQFFPDLIKKGHVYILQTPLFRVRNKKKTIYCYTEEERQKAIAELSPNPEITRFKGLGEISPDEFRHFIGKDMRLEQVTLRKTDLVKELLEFYMGKNTMERQNFIINNLVIEEDLAS